jgi:hypothetical protein
MKKKAALALSVSAFLIVASTSVGIAQEGGLGGVVDRVVKAVSENFGPVAEEADSEAASQEAFDAESPSLIAPPVTYENGFTEGDVLDSSGVPTYSSKEFVPTGPDAPKQGEINPCVTKPDIQACEAAIYRESWERERPDGSEWTDLKLTDEIFLANYVPPLWINSVTGETRASQQTSYYLYHNAHKHATSIPEPIIFTPGAGSPPLVRFTPQFSIENTSYIASATQDMYPMVFTAKLKNLGTAEEFVIWQPNTELFYDAGLRNRSVDLGSLYDVYAPACSKVTVELTIRTAYKKQSFTSTSKEFVVPAPDGASCAKPSLGTFGMTYGWVLETDENSDPVVDFFYTNFATADLYGVDAAGLENSFISLSSSTQSFWIENPSVTKQSKLVQLYFDKFQTKNKAIPFGLYEVQLWVRNQDSVLAVLKIGSVDIGSDTNRGELYVGTRP